MMVLIGVRDSNVKNGEILDSKCPKCKSTSILYFSIYRKYTHITLIPLFPIGKYVNIKCSSCEEFLDYEDLTENGQLQLRNEKLKNSIWMFTGVFILICSFVYGIYYYLNIKDDTLTNIKNPQKSDVYELKVSNGYYSTIRIDKVSNDSVEFTENDYKTYSPFDVNDIDRPENYTTKKVYYSKKDLIKLYQKDEILSITRK